MMHSPVLQGQAPGLVCLPHRCDIRNLIKPIARHNQSTTRRSRKVETAASSAGVLTAPQNIPRGPAVAEDQGRGLSQYLRDSVAILEAPNPASPDGKAKVYVLGVSHVSKRDCELVTLPRHH